MDSRVKKEILLLIVIWSLFFGVHIVRAWTNPSQNPPGGGGALRANSAGDIGIGRDPGKKLDVDGAIRFKGHFITNAANGALVLNAGPADASNNAGIWFRKDTTLGEEGVYTDLGRLTEAGNLGLGTIAPATKLEVVGTASATEARINKTRLYGTADSSGAFNILSQGDLIWARPNSTLGTLNNPRIIAGGTGGNALLELRDEGDAAIVKLYATSSMSSFINSRRLGVREPNPLATFSLGDAVSLTNNAVSFIAQNLSSLGSDAGSVVYPFEFRGLTSNENRLLLMNYRRVAGTDWNSAGWRLQAAVDNSFTTPATGRAYVEFYSGGAELYLGTDGVDRVRILSTGETSVQSNKIINLATPTADTDAANKLYVDSQTGGPKTTKIWGEGRQGSGTINSAGECTVGDIKVSRSSRAAHWDGAAGACPQGWWVCRESERGAGACGTGEYRRVNCDPTADLDEFTTGYTPNAWVEDQGNAGEIYQGRQVSYDGTAGNQSICTIQPVWCCK